MAVNEIIVVNNDQQISIVDNTASLSTVEVVNSNPVATTLSVLAGQQGVPGPANALSIGSVTTSAPGSSAAATITGTSPTQTLNLTLPTGATGPANTLTMGTVTQLYSGQTPTASITGTAPNQTLSLSLPKGAEILSGATAPAAGTGSQNDWYINTATWDMSKKTSSTVWTTQLNIRGATGPANTLTTGTTTVLDSTQSPSVSITGTAPNQTVTFSLPKGAEILSGTAAPTAGTGQVGDLYLNTTTWDLSKKTNSTTWTLQVNTRGATGPAPNLAIGTTTTGAAGSSASATITGTNPNYSLNLTIPKGDVGTQWYTGTGAPSGATGVVNDFYIVTGGITGLGDVYKKTGASTWTLQGNIRGASGAGNVSYVNMVSPDGNGNVAITNGTMAPDATTVTTSTATNDWVRFLTLTLPSVNTDATLNITAISSSINNVSNSTPITADITIRARNASGLSGFSIALTINNSHGFVESDIVAVTTANDGTNPNVVEFYIRRAAPSQRWSFFERARAINNANITIAYDSTSAWTATLPAGAQTAATKSYVDTVNAQTIAGSKVFSSNTSMLGTVVLGSGQGSGGTLIAYDVNGTGGVLTPATRKFGVVRANTYDNGTPYEVILADSSSSSINRITIGGRNTGSNTGATEIILATTPTPGTPGTSVDRLRVDSTGIVTITNGIASNGVISVTTGGLTSQLQGNNLIFNRNGTSYIDQATVGGTISFRLSASTTIDTLVATIASTGLTLNTGSFSGNGSGLTSLNGSNISTGTVADARLSTNVSLLNAAQTYSGAKTFSATTIHSLGLRISGGGITNSSSASGFISYNTADEATNWERLRMVWASNKYQIYSEAAGTGVIRDIAIGSSGTNTLWSASAVTVGTGTGKILSDAGTTGTVYPISNITNLNSSNSTQHAFYIRPTVSQTSTAGYSGFSVDVQESTIGSGLRNIATFQTGGVTRAQIRSSGQIDNYLTADTANALANRMTLDSYPLSGRNIISDNSFENNTVTLTGANGATVTRSTEQARSGQYSAKVVQPTFAGQAGMNIQGVSFVPYGNDVILTAWVYIPSTGGPSGGVALSLQGTSLSSSIGTSYYNITGKWFKIQQRATLLASGTLSLYVLSNNPTAGQYFYVDDVSLQYAEDAVLDSSNGYQSFEGNKNFNGTITVVQQGGSDNLVAVAAGSGGYAMSVRNTSGTTISGFRGSDGALIINTIAGMTSGGGTAGGAFISLSNGTGNATIRQQNAGSLVLQVLGASGQTGRLQEWHTGTSVTAWVDNTGAITAPSFSGSGASLTSLNGSNISTGTVAPARLGTGASATTFLRGDSTFQTLTLADVPDAWVKRAVRVASTANITIPPGGTSLTIDGVALANNDRVLLKNQTTTSQNGIYVVGGIGTSVTLTRATDADAASEIAGGTVSVDQGTQGGQIWSTTFKTTDTLGTTGMLWYRVVDTSLAGVSGGYENFITAGTTAQYWRGDKTWQTLNSTAVGLGNVPNYSGDKMRSETSATGLTAGWIRIASQANGKGIATFTAWDNTSSVHNYVEFNVSITYNEKPQITVLNSGAYSGLSITGVRIAQDKVTAGPVFSNPVYLEVQIQNITELSVAMTTNTGNAPWTLLTPSNTALGANYTTFTTLNLDGTSYMGTTGKGLFPFKTTTTSESSIIVGDNIALPTGTGQARVQIGSTNSESNLLLGQSNSNGLLFAWKYNATAANAYGLLETYGGNNLLALQVTGGNVAIGKATANGKLDVNGVILGTAAVMRTGTYSIAATPENSAVAIANISSGSYSGYGITMASTSNNIQHSIVTDAAGNNLYFARHSSGQTNTTLATMNTSGLNLVTGSYSGNGSGLTSLNASNLSTGTIPVGRMLTATTGNSSNLYTNYYAKVCTVTINGQYVDANLVWQTIGGASGGTASSSPTITFRVKQQNAMGSAPRIELEVQGNYGFWIPSKFVAVTTQNDATATVVSLYAQFPQAYEQLWFYETARQTSGATVLQFSGDAPVISLPAGNVTTAIDGNDMAASPILSATKTVSGAWTFSGTTSISNGTLTLSNGAANTIVYGAAGVAAPTFTTRSAGTKIVLFSAISASSADYAIGIEGSTLWNSVPASSQQFKWYGGTTNVATLTGAGALSTTTSVSAPAVTSSATTNSLNTQRFIFTVATAARPTGTAYVEWVGPVQPNNAIDGDTWINTTG